MQRQSLFVFDIETVPDTDAVPNLVGEVGGSVEQRREALEAYHLDATNGQNAFPRQPFHRVVAISYLVAEIEQDGVFETYFLKDLRSGGDVKSPERDLVAGFYQWVDKKHPRLVSYNGRGFDLPVLRHRAMVHGVTAHAYHDTSNKWDNYTSRYAQDLHCDLLEALTDFGAASRGLKLNEVCAVLGFPGKFGVDGSQVAPMFDEGRVGEIRDYCETDVLNTYLVYLRYQLTRAKISRDGYNRAVADIISFIEAEQTARPHLGAFLEAWGAASGNRFLLD
ncbi:MAG: 3'-5' exonuclease [Alphaproteobacteria bacterium]|nr:3'-5' exonuclease [Alphaproteobacteria bacterium]